MIVSLILFNSFAYVDFSKHDSVIQALKMNGKMVSGRSITVDFDSSQAKKGFKLKLDDEGNEKYN